MSVAPLLQLEAAMIRRQLPDLLLRPGMTLFARVAERSGQHGIIMLAGSPLVAQLPDEVAAGQSLRLLVEDTRGEKVTMKLVQEQPVAPPTGSAVPVPLPGGLEARGGGGEREGDPDDPPHAAVFLSFDSPAPGAGGVGLLAGAGGASGGG